MTNTLEKDLEWYYHCADHELGIKSNFFDSSSAAILPVQPMFHPNTTATPIDFATYKGLSPFSKKQYRACRRISEIKEKLSNLTKQDRRKIDALFAGYRFPQELKLLHNKHYALALFYPFVSTIDQLLDIATFSSYATEKAQIKIFINNEYDRLHYLWSKMEINK